MSADAQAIENTQKEIIDEFNFLGDWTERYKYIIDLGKELEKMDEDDKTDELKIKGCQSNVWLQARMNKDKVKFNADSDALIVKGLIALLIRVLGNRDPEDIANADLFFIPEIGMNEHLSPTRSNGLASMVKQMKLYGVALAQQKKN